MVAHGKIHSSCVVFLFTVIASVALAQPQEPGSSAAVERSKTEVNVLTDCGARGDGTTDDSNALQQCIATHPGKTIVFPKTRDKAQCDYKIHETLSVTAFSTSLVGVGGTTNNNTTLCWDADVTGIRLHGGAGEAIRNLNLRGNSPFKPRDTSTYAVGTSDGILVRSGEVSIRDVYVVGFSRHGVNVDSTQGGQADVWIFDNARSEGNRGDGFHFVGVDSNGGLCLMCISRLNQGWGFFNHAVIPSTYIAPLTDSNHNDPTAPERTVPIAQITVTKGIATVTTTATHQTIAGDWGVFLNCDKFPIKAPIIAVPSLTTLQIATTNPDGTYCNTHSSTYGFKAGARVWAMGRKVDDVVVKAGNSSITSVQAHWTADDYGTLVCIDGAGTDGKEFCSTVKAIYGNNAVLSDAPNNTVQPGKARIVINGGPYNSANSTFVQSYTESNQEGDSQLVGSLTLGAEWGKGANPEIDNFLLANGYATPLSFVRLNASGGYGHSVFQAGRAFGSGSIARDPSYEGFWNTEEFDDQMRLLATLSFRHSNVIGAAASGWNCFSENPRMDGSALAASSICLPDAQTKVSINGKPTPTQLPMFPAGGFWIKAKGIADEVASTSGLRQIRYDATDAPKSCNIGDIFYKAFPTSGSYMGWVCPAPDTPLPFGGIASSKESTFSERVPAPKSASAECSVGQWAADAGYYYVCEEKNTWRRAALSSW